MKKAFIVFIIGIIFFGIYSVQNVSAQSTNDAQRIVGTWKPEGVELIFTFNVNGTFTISGANLNEELRMDGNYFVNNQKLILRGRGEALASEIIDYYISSDGRILVFQYIFINTNYSELQHGFFWFIKE